MILDEMDNLVLYNNNKMKIGKYLTLAALFFSAALHGKSHNVGRNPKQWELNPDGK